MTVQFCKYGTLSAHWYDNVLIKFPSKLKIFHFFENLNDESSPFSFIKQTHVENIHFEVYCPFRVKSIGLMSNKVL